jgi:hypothetical protein
MLPVTDGLLGGQIEVVEQPTGTFYLDIGRNTVHGLVDGREAMAQAIYLILSVERYMYPTLPWSYGVELGGLLGMPMSWAIPEAERRIREALMQDTRVRAVDGFAFEAGKGKLTARFTAHTIFGDIDAEKEVPV